MRKIFFVVFILILISVIYFCTYKKSTILFSIGNLNGDISYVPEYTRITDIIIDIENNINVDGNKIQNLLVKAFRIELDLANYVKFENYNDVITGMNDVEDLIINIKKYTKEKIMINLLEEQNILYEYANKKILLLAKKYDIMILR